MEKLKASVRWEESYERGLERCREERKPLLLDFFKEG